jgi:hypothetical protein
LLKISRKSLEILLIRQDRDGLSAEKVVIPEREEAHEHRKVAPKGSGPIVFVHLVKPQSVYGGPTAPSTICVSLVV